MFFQQAIEGFQRRGGRRANPGSPPSSTEFLQYLVDIDFPFDELDEEEWRGMGEGLGMNDAQINDLLENAASYME